MKGHSGVLLPSGSKGEFTRGDISLDKGDRGQYKNSVLRKTMGLGIFNDVFSAT